MDLMEVVGGLAPGGLGLQEAWTDPGFYDPDIDLTSEQGGALYYRRLTTSPSDLQPLVHERMQELAAHLYDRNPVAKRAMNIIRDHVVGEGFQVSSKDEAVEEVLRKVWDDPINEMVDRISDIALELGVFGEQAVACFVHRGSGHVAFAYIDPRTIHQVISTPGRPDQPYAISLRGQDAITEPRWVKVIQPGADGLLTGIREGDTLKVAQDSDPVPFWQPTGLDPSTYLAGCFFWAINKTRGARRGRSDLLPVMDFVDLYDKLVFDDAERMSFMRAFVWDVEVANASAEELRQRAASETPPRPGTVLYRNQNEKWNPISPDLKAADGASTADLVLSLIATGVGVSKTWLNGAMDVNRATAGAMDEPTRKTLRRRQGAIAQVVERLATYAVHSAVQHGSLGLPAGGAVLSVSTPEMYNRDLQRGAGALFSVTQGLGLAKASGWMDSETPLQVLVNMLAEVGVNLEASELKERIESERAAAQTAAGDAAGGLVPTDASAKDAAGIATQVAAALVQLGQSSVIDVEVAQDIFARLMQPLGITIDLKAMRARLEEEEAEAKAEQEEAMAAAASVTEG